MNNLRCKGGNVIKLNSRKLGLQDQKFPQKSMGACKFLHLEFISNFATVDTDQNKFPFVTEY